MAPVSKACKRKIETSVCVDLSLALPGTHITSASQPNDDDLYCDMMKQFKVNVVDVCRKKLNDEVKKTEAVEAELRHAKTLCKNYVDKIAKLEDKVLRRMALHGAKESAGSGKEGVGTSYDINARKVGIMCRKCESRMANTVFYACRHLCLCTECSDKVKACPICNAR